MREKSSLSMNTTLRKPLFRGGETRVMKKLLSSLLVFALVFTMLVPAFAFAADEKPSAEEMAKQLSHIFQGDENGNLNLDKPMDRASLAKVLALLLELDVTAPTGEPAFSDVSSNWAYQQGYITAVTTTVPPLMQGVGNGEFNPLGTVSYAEIATVLARILGVSVEGTTPWYAGNLAAVQELGFLTDLEDATAAAPRAVLVEAAWIANEALTVPEVVDLAVESVSATNLREVVVTFNKEVDLTNATFTLSPAAGTLTPELSADKKTVTLTTSADLTNQGAYKLTLDKVADLDGNVLAKTVKEFTVFDAQLPTALEIVTTGPKSFDIVFSEPIKKTGKVAVKSSSTTLAVASANADGTNTVSVSLYTSLTDGTVYDVTVSDYEDFAGYKNVIKTFKYQYAKDNNAPVASLVSANQQYVVISFDKPVTGLDKNNFYHTFTSWGPIDVYPTLDDMNADTNAISTTDTVTKVYVLFATDGIGQHPLQPGNVNIHVLGKVGSTDVKDNWGNKLSDTVLTANIVADLTAPEVTEVKVTANNKFKVTFSEAVSNANNAANYEVLDADGKTVSLNGAPSVSADKKSATVELSGSSYVGKTLTVNIKNITDDSLNKNKLVGTFTTTLTFEDKEFAGVARVEYDSTAKVLYVVYNEEMGNSAIDIANYRLNDDVEGIVALEGPASFFAGNSVVKIELSDDENALIHAGTDSLLIGNKVTDIHGNASSAFQISEGIKAIGTAKPGIVTDGIVVTGEHTVTVQFDQELVAVDPTDFELSIDNGVNYEEPTALSLTNNSKGTLVTLTFEDSIPGDVPSTVLLRATFTSGTVNVFGVSPTNVLATQPEDGYAPVVVSVEYKSSTVIHVTFSEDLAADTFATAATLNGFSVAGGKAKITGAELDTPGSDSNVVVITGTDFVKDVTTVSYTPGFITDTNGNKLAKFENEVAE